MGIYTVPEISSVGLNEAEARERYGDAITGRCPFDEVARGHIGGNQNGLLKIVSDPAGEKTLGVQIIGEGAIELIHVGQMAMIGGKGIDTFVENIFNFPTLAEAYRVAALDVVEQRAGLRRPDEGEVPAAAAS
jgi:NAD(P) transhydrogenase